MVNIINWETARLLRRVAWRGDCVSLEQARRVLGAATCRAQAHPRLREAVEAILEGEEAMKRWYRKWEPTIPIPLEENLWFGVAALSSKHPAAWYDQVPAPDQAETKTVSASETTPVEVHQ